jgi:hypothetical protein
MSHVIYWSDSNGNTENVHGISHGLKFMDQSAYSVHKGDIWSLTDKHSIASSGGTRDHLLQINSGEALHLNTSMFNTTKGPADVFIYEAPFIDASSLGTDISSSYHCHNRALNKITPFVAYEDPYTDANSLGTKIDYNLMEQVEGGPVQVSAGSTDGVPTEWHLDYAKNYLVRFINNHGTDTAVVQCRMTLFKV